MIKMLLLNRYDRLGASSRMRMLQYMPYFSAEGIECRAEPLLGDEYLKALYGKRRISVFYLLARYLRRLRVLLAARRFDVVFIEKEIFPNFPAWAERFLAWRKVPYVIDFDDAIFHNYDLAKNPLKRLLKNKIGVAMRYAHLVTAGNSYLARHAAVHHARRIALLPTVIDLRTYPHVAPRENGPVVIGWIGSPFTVAFLEPLFPVLARLRERFSFELTVIGGEVDTKRHSYARNVAWSEQTEVNEIARFDIGVMPLSDGPWERGKCSYKLIQYMACGKPVVASPVGMNADVVQHGANGFVAETPEQWFEALSRLLEDASLRREMGAVGRSRVEEKYCLQVTAPQLVHWLKHVASRKGEASCAE